MLTPARVPSGPSRGRRGRRRGRAGDPTGPRRDPSDPRGVRGPVVLPEGAHRARGVRPGGGAPRGGGGDRPHRVLAPRGAGRHPLPVLPAPAGPQRGEDLDLLSGPVRPVGPGPRARVRPVHLGLAGPGPTVGFLRAGPGRGGRGGASYPKGTPPPERVPNVGPGPGREGVRPPPRTRDGGTEGLADLHRGS